MVHLLLRSANLAHVSGVSAATPTHWVLANHASQRGYHNIVLRCVRSVGASVRHPTAAINVPNNSFKADGFAAA